MFDVRDKRLEIEEGYRCHKKKLGVGVSETLKTLERLKIECSFL